MGKGTDLDKKGRAPSPEASLHDRVAAGASLATLTTVIGHLKTLLSTAEMRDSETP